MDGLWGQLPGDWRRFPDRRGAGAGLAAALGGYRGKDALVLGIPRGGVVVAAEVARQLDAALDIVAARKLGAPRAPELAIGAVTANGGLFLNGELIRELGVPDTYLDRVVAAETAEARRQETQFRSGRSQPWVKDRVVIIVDDGLATGATMRAAATVLRGQHPAELVVAVPVGAREACAVLEEEADQFVCLLQPEPFDAVGLFYDHFEPTPDGEVQSLLEEAYAARGQDDTRRIADQG